MPRRSKVYDLPPEIRDELNAKLVANGFQDYEGLEKWLAEQGFEIKKSSIHRYGQLKKEEFEEAMADVKKASELARAYVSGDPDEQNALLDANARIAQEGLLRIQIALRKLETEPEKAAKHIAQVTRALADLGRMSITQKKWAAEIRGQERERAANLVAETALAQGMNEDQARFWREKVLGVKQ